MTGVKDRYHQAARDGYLDVLKEATRKDCDAHDNDGMTPVLWAAFCGNLEALRVLMSRGGNPDKTDIWGNTALHYASANGHLACVTFLVNFGANIWSLDNDFHSALELAALCEHEEIVKFLDEMAEKRTRSSKNTVQKLKQKAYQHAQKRIKQCDKLRQQTSKQMEKESSMMRTRTVTSSSKVSNRSSLTSPGSTVSIKPASRGFLTNPLAAGSATQRIKHYSEHFPQMQNTSNGWQKGSGNGTTRSGAVAKKVSKKKGDEPQLFCTSSSDLNTSWDDARSSRSRHAMSEPGGLYNDTDTLRAFSSDTEQRPGLFVRPGFGSVAFFSKPNTMRALMSFSADDDASPQPILPRSQSTESTPSHSNIQTRRSVLQNSTYHDGQLSSVANGNGDLSGRPRHTSDTDSIGTNDSLLKRMETMPWSESELLDIGEDDDECVEPGARRLDAFLAAHGLSQLGHTLADEGIDLPALMLCSEGDLQSIGLTLGPRRKLLDAVAKRKHIMENPGCIKDSYL